LILVFDCETNGLLDELDTIHCISLQEVDETGAPRGPILSANDHGTGEMTVRQAVERLKKAKRVVGHNIAGFDIPAIAKVFPDFKVQAYFDTLLMSTLVYPDLKDRDFKARKKQGANPVLPGKLIGRHALEAWGYRLGRWKGDYAAQMAARGLDPWAQWSQEMDDYCDQDVAVTQALFALLMSKGLPTEAIELEQAVAPILSRQQRYGYLFDQEKARELECILVSRRTALEAELRKVIPPWKVVKRKFVPKRDDKRRGYVKGVEVTTYKDVVFNPASRQHIADRLTAMYGWQPQEFTEKGQPKIDEEVLGALKFPIIPLLLEHFIVNKRLGQLAEGGEAWLKAIKKDGRIHGSVNQNAAVTGRMTHSKPNIAQVPKVQHSKEKGILKGQEGGYGFGAARCSASQQEAPGRRGRLGIGAALPGALHGKARRRRVRQGHPRRRHPLRQPIGGRTANPRQRQDLHLRLPLRGRRREARLHRWQGSPGRGEAPLEVPGQAACAGEAGTQGQEARGREGIPDRSRRPEAAHPQRPRRAQYPAPVGRCAGDEESPGDPRRRPASRRVGAGRPLRVPRQRP
jgi:hypothetical protein